MKVASEMVVLDFSSELHTNRVVSLVNDGGETWIGTQNLKPFYLYDQKPFSAKYPRHPRQDTSAYKDERFATLILKIPRSLFLMVRRKQGLGWNWLMTFHQ